MRKYKFTDIKSITLTKRDYLIIKKVAYLMRTSKENALSLIVNVYCCREGINDVE